MSQHASSNESPAPPTAPITPEPASAHPVGSTLAQKIAWVLCDWANSGFGLIIMGPLFSPYFVGMLLPEQPKLPARADGAPAHGLDFGSFVMPASAVFALMTSLIAVLVTLTSPPLGAMADLKAWTKRLFTTFVTAGCLISLLCFFLEPGRWVLGASIYVTSAYCFAVSIMFNNAFLPSLVPVHQQGRMSGAGFACGYVGGAVALIVAYLVLHKWADFRLETALAFAGVWWFVFSIPAFILLREFRVPVQSSTRKLVRLSFHRVFETFRHLRRYQTLFIFLTAFLIYNNGIDTAINISAAFSEDVLNMDPAQQIVTFLIVQFVAAGGAVVNGWLADRVGNKPVIVWNLLIWCVAVTLCALVRTPLQFTMLGVLIGLVIGGSQSSSRALMAKLTPREIHNEAFGFFSLSGKAVSIFGPLLFAGVATVASPRHAVFAVLPFFVVGLIVLLWVKEPPAKSP
jgi:UMF1 family MFS transporter